jgi:hypothetical protein
MLEAKRSDLAADKEARPWSKQKSDGLRRAEADQRGRRRARRRRKKNIWIGIKHELRVREREKAYALIPC